MTMTFEQLVAEACGRVDAVAPAEADGLILDVREPSELDQAGLVAGAFAIPRGARRRHAAPHGLLRPHD